MLPSHGSIFYKVEPLFHFDLDSQGKPTLHWVTVIICDDFSASHHFTQWKNYYYYLENNF